jgi:GntR family transcriptional regulator/MocR family aminotransferase
MRARAAGVAVHAGGRFSLDGQPAPYLRIGFAACNERELAEAVRRLAATRQA